MRSLFSPAYQVFVQPGRSATAWGPLLGALGLSVALAAPAIAEEVLPAPPVVGELSPPTASAQTTTTTVTTTTAGAPTPPAMPPMPGAVSGPVYYNGPVWIIPAPVTGQPFAAPPALAPLPPPPVYVQPGYQARTARCCTAPIMARAQSSRAPRFSIGARFTTMGINQEVFGQNLNLLGGGLQLRFRNGGHWGFETAFDVLRANVGDGAFVRMSYPWTAGVMLYLFKNRVENHFNIFGVAGVGLLADDVTLYKGSRQERNQQFLEVMAQAGGGVELRFNRLALSADIRAIGLMMDTSGPAGRFYEGVDSGPIPTSSVGYKANLGANLWF